MTAAGYQWSRPPDPRRPGLRALVDLLHLFRLDAGLPRGELSRRAGVSVNAIEAAENGYSRPRQSTLARIVEGLGGCPAPFLSLQWCGPCARSVLAVTLTTRWPPEYVDDGHAVRFPGPPAVTTIALRNATAIRPLLDVARIVAEVGP